MKKLVLTVFIENKEYESALAVGLCREASGIEVRKASSVEEAELQAISGVLITDREAYGSFVVRPEDGKRLTVGEIIRRAKTRYFNIAGIPSASADEREPCVWEMYSTTGGAGVTSLAIMAARLLAMEDEKVLYLNLGSRDDYSIYAAADFSNLPPKRKFLYKVLESGEPFAVEEFLTKDQWGVMYFKPEEGRNCFESERCADKLMAFLYGTKEFDHIVADSCGEPWSGSVVIRVVSRRDKRPETAADGGVFRILNFAGRNGDQEEFSVPEDESAFEENGAGINLSMESEMAEAMARIVRALREKVGESR